MAWKRIGLTIGQLLIIGMLLTAGYNPANAAPVEQATLNWSKPLAFDRNGWFPDITADATGRLHVAWSNSVINAIQSGSTMIRQGYDVVLYTSSADGVTWSPINEVAALRQTTLNNVEVTRPAMLVDQKGMMHMTFRDINVYYAKAPVNLTEQANYWTESVQMNTNGLAYFSRLAQDSQGRLHMVYTEDIPTSDCMICYHVMYRNSDNEGDDWSSETDISVIPTGAAKPTILVDNKDNIHVTWESGRGGTLGQLSDPTTVMYTVSYNRGQSWSTPVEIAAPEAERSKNITIGQDGRGNLVMVWWSLPEDTIYYQVSMDNGLTWLQPTLLPNVWGVWGAVQSRLDTFSMATDSGGDLHLVMVGRLSADTEQISLIHLIWDGANWSAPDPIVTYNGDQPEWPRIVITNGNELNVVWFVRPEDYIWLASVDYYKVWFSRARTNAPYVPSGIYPTLIPPTPTVATVAPTEIGLPTAYPTTPPLNTTLDTNQVGRDTYTEIGQLSIMAVALVPTIALVGVLLAVILIRRR
ncbi:MAG TPA: sialidase family protein [Anaerolineaceae bacterium]